MKPTELKKHSLYRLPVNSEQGYMDLKYIGEQNTRMDWYAFELVDERGIQWFDESDILNMQEIKRGKYLKIVFESSI